MPTAVFQIFSHNSLDLQQLQHLSLTCSGCVDVYLNPYRRCSKTRVVIVNFSIGSGSSAVLSALRRDSGSLLSSAQPQMLLVILGTSRINNLQMIIFVFTSCEDRL